MAISDEVANLTTAVDNLTATVNVKKQTLDTAVSNAQTAVTDATSQVSLAAAEKVGAQTARDTAESFKDQAYTYSQSAASAVAYQDLTAIAQTKVETAVDVFVYDTSKDSDGGAWRKRTQHTSWYNETLNTATRGSRKEFPAVAVIVAEAGKVTIYDGDDPTLPMWMVFNQVSRGFLYASANAVSMYNGLLVEGGGANLSQASFVKDEYFFRNTNGLKWNLNTLINRNLTGGPLSYGAIPAIVNTNVNDVAMTVLPDAPIDPATGLPIPTIAVATDGGVSVIKDDGNVYDFNQTKIVNNVSFLDDNKILILQESSGGYAYVYPNPTDINEDSVSSLQYLHWSITSNYPSIVGQFFSGTLIKDVVGSPYGMTKLSGSPYDMGCDITSDYNTGWMNGDIKLATLSDTDDTDLVGTELVTNGTFDTDLSGWTGNLATLSQSNGQLVVTGTSSEAANQFAGQTVTHPQDAVLVVSFEITELTANAAGAGIIASGAKISKNNGLHYWYPNGVGVYKTTVKTSGTTTSFRLHAGTHVGVITKFDNVSVRIAEPDRSVNNNGLQVFGTVTREPVATGADLVAYSGFTGSNYLEQPYNSDLDFGTGDFCVMGWVSRLENDMTILYTGTTVSNGINIWGYHANLKIRVGGASVDVGHETGNGFSFITVIRKSGVVYIYINGTLKASASAPNTINYNGIKVGTGFYAGSLSSFKLALLRISATVPTAEQIAKIYEDEKVLFQEGAQATLYGTSDAVTALAYDDTTELLHVGTSGGRSVFQGLKRVDNTTDAVGTAISASNNLVVEE